MINALLAEGDAYDLIFDDGGAGEIADVVLLRVTEGLVQMTLYHCKYLNAVGMDCGISRRCWGRPSG